MGQIIAIVSQKGGVGKTSTAVNLGACISAINRKVLLIGLDPQCGLAKSFGLESEDTPAGLLDVVRDGAAPQDAIYAANPRLPHLSLIPSNVRSVADEAFYYGILQRDVTMFSRVLEQLRPAYDFIFLDCPPRMDNPTYAALTAADSYLVPIQCEYASMGTVGRVLRAALEIKRLHNTKLAIFGFLLTMADKRAGFTIRVVQEVRQYLKDRVFRTIVPRDPRLAEVPYRQAPVIAFDIQSPGSKAYIQLAREVLRGDPGPKGKSDDSTDRGNSKIRVLVVDDSALMSRQITAILQNDEKMQVVGWAKDGLEALNMVRSLRPDVVTMDVEMPRMNGITALKHIMVKHPIPTVMISALTVEGARTTFDALKYGAIDVIAKPSRREDVSLDAQKAEIVAKVKRAAAIRTGRSRYMRISPRPPGEIRNSKGRAPDPATRFIGIGTGTGGYYALLRIIPLLAPGFQDVLVAVILAGSRYVDPFVSYLDAHSAIPVKKADGSTSIEQGTCYLCSGDSGPFLDTDADGNVRFSFVPRASHNGTSGAIDRMFESYAHVAGSRAVGIIMTGSGTDGAEGLTQIREAGGTTVIQDINNCVDPSMPLAVLEKGSVTKMLPDYLIADFLTSTAAPEN